MENVNHFLLVGIKKEEDLIGQAGGVSPKLFEQIIFSGLYRKYVGDKIAVIHQDPFCIFPPLYAQGPYLLFFQLLFNALTDGYILPFRITLHDDKVICEGRYLPQIENEDIFRFFSLARHNGHLHFSGKVSFADFGWIWLIHFPL